MELTNYFIDILGTLSDYLTGQSQLYFFRYFSLFSFPSLWKTLCKVKGSVGCWSNPLNCFNERRQSNLSCNMLYYTNANWQLQYQLLKLILQIMQIWGARKTRGAPIYIYIYLYIYIYMCKWCTVYFKKEYPVWKGLHLAYIRALRSARARKVEKKSFSFHLSFQNCLGQLENQACDLC